MRSQQACRRYIATLGCGCVAGIILSLAAASAQAPKVGDPPEASNMRLVGYDGLQARSAYQPTIHRQGERFIAYVGHHGGTERVPKPVNPLTGVAEFSGTSILDVTDPAHPKYLRHIPGQEGTYEQGGAQMVRVCDGKALPKGDPNSVYLLRTFGGQAHEIWNVADPAKPELVARIDGLQDTHKSWWECETGIAYLVSGAPGWRTRRMTQVYDLSDPAHPAKIRDFGLPGQQPGATGTVPTELHGPISTGPEGNRIYFGYGTNKGGILQIVDRAKLLNGAKEPTPDNLRYPEIGRLELSPIVGAHTTFPMSKMPIAEFAHDKFGATRDIVMIVDESLVNECQEPPGILQEAGVHHLLQRRRSRARRARSLPAEGSRLLHPGDHREHRSALPQGERTGPMQDRDPEQQRRDRRARLHLFGRSRQHRAAHPGAHGQRQGDRRIAVVRSGVVPGPERKRGNPGPMTKAVTSRIGGVHGFRLSRFARGRNDAA